MFVLVCLYINICICACMHEFMYLHEYVFLCYARVYVTILLIQAAWTASRGAEHGL